MSNHKPQSLTDNRVHQERAENVFLGLGLISAGVGIWVFAGWGGIALYMSAIFMLTASMINRNKSKE